MQNVLVSVIFMLFQANSEFWVLAREYLVFEPCSEKYVPVANEEINKWILFRKANKIWKVRVESTTGKFKYCKWKHSVIVRFKPRTQITHCSALSYRVQSPSLQKQLWSTSMSHTCAALRFQWPLSPFAKTSLNISGWYQLWSGSYRLW